MKKNNFEKMWSLTLKLIGGKISQENFEKKLKKLTK